MPLRLAAFAPLPLVLALAAPAAAQDEEDPYAACAALAGDTERLACFDATYAEQQVVRAEAEAREEELIEESFGRRDEDEQIERDDVTVTATVSELLRGSRNSQVILLDNGQLWRETTGSTMRNRMREGWSVTISRHWSGAYEMRVDGRSGYLRVTRVR